VGKAASFALPVPRACRVTCGCRGARARPALSRGQAVGPRTGRPGWGPQLVRDPPPAPLSPWPGGYGGRVRRCRLVLGKGLGQEPATPSRWRTMHSQLPQVPCRKSLVAPKVVRHDSLIWRTPRRRAICCWESASCGITRCMAGTGWPAGGATGWPCQAWLGDCGGTCVRVYGRLCDAIAPGGGSSRRESRKEFRRRRGLPSGWLASPGVGQGAGTPGQLAVKSLWMVQVSVS
jgi:hypothetical protein